MSNPVFLFIVSLALANILEL